MAGISSINAWKSIYYAFKVSLAMVTSALKDINQQNNSPYVNGFLNGNGAVHRLYSNGTHLKGSHQNGHHASAEGANGLSTSAGAHSPGAQNGATPNATEVAQPASADSLAPKSLV
jgi:hypothetical protein